MKLRGRWWPGEAERSVPPGFPGATSSDESKAPGPVVSRSVPTDVPEPHRIPDTGQVQRPKPKLPARRRRVAKAVRRIRSSPVVFWPGLSETSVPPDFLADRTTSSTPRVAILPSRAGSGSSANSTATEPARRGRRRLPPGLRFFGAVVTAVYAALADPLVGADDAAREHRTAQIRRAGMVTAGGALTAILVYSIFPVRTYLDQRAATQQARERLEVISRENERLADQAEDLRDPETVEEIARRDYGLVFPGEESYGVLPPPVETTTTAPTTTTVPLPP